MLLICHFIVYKFRDDAVKKLTIEIINCYSEKIKMYNLYDNSFLKEESHKLYFLTPLEQINESYTSFIIIINKLLKKIIDSPKFIYKIIKYSTDSDLNNSFLLFITNNLYNDILSPELISEKLLIIIENLLCDEINKISDINDLESILTYSKVSKLFLGFKYFNEVQNYFNLLLGDIIENYENSGISTIHLIFKIDKLEQHIRRKEELINNEIKSEKEFKREEAMRKKSDEINTLNNIYKMKFKIDDNVSLSSNSISGGAFSYEEEGDFHNEMNNIEIFMRKYAPDLNKNELKDILKKHSDNECIQNYLNKQLNLLSKNENLFSNSIFFQHIQVLKDSEKILYYYQRNFNIVRDIILQVYQKLKITTHLIPYCIKCICKIIYNLIKLKFPNLKAIEINKYIKIFCFKIILEEFILSSDFSIMITTTIISKETKENLKIIFDIWKHFIFGNFYTNDNKDYTDYTPFNWFFIDLIEENFVDYLKLLDIDISHKLLRKNMKNKNIINNVENFEINKKIYSYSACFTIDDLITLLKIINNNKNDIFDNEIISDEFKQYFNQVNKIEKILISLKRKNDLNSLNYYLYYEVFYSYEIANIILQKKEEEYFKIEEIKNVKTNKDKELNNLIKIKNYLCNLLFNSDLISFIDKTKIKINNLKQLIEELEKYNKLESLIFTNDNNKMNDYEYLVNADINNNISEEIFPFRDNNINPYILLIEKLNEKYSKNNYQLLFNPLYKSISSSMTNYNFEILSPILDILNNIKQTTHIYLLNQEKYKHNIFNSKIRNFIENENIEVIIKFKYNENEHYFSISNIDKNTKILKNDNIIKCHTIPDFIRKFPDLWKLQLKKEVDLLDLKTELNLKEQLSEYFNIIREHLNKKFPEKEIKNVHSKIKKRIIIKLYNKIFPKEPDDEDLTFHFKCISLSWIKPKHLNQKEIYNENFIKVTTNLFNQMNIEKSYSGKLEIIDKIFINFSNLLKINKGDSYSTDDIAPICEYALIKAKPERLSSNLKFIQIMMSEKCSNLSKMHFDYLKDTINTIKDCDHTHFHGVSEKEFQDNCYKAKNDAFENQ